MKPDQTEYIALENLNNGIEKHQKFPASRLSKFTLNDFVSRGKVRRVLSKKELAAHCKELEELFHGTAAK